VYSCVYALGPDPRPGAGVRQLSEARPGRRNRCVISARTVAGTCGTRRRAELLAKSRDGARPCSGTLSPTAKAMGRRDYAVTGAGDANGPGACRNQTAVGRARVGMSRARHGRRHTSGGGAPFTFPATGVYPFPGNEPREPALCPQGGGGPEPGPPRTRPSWCPPRMATHAAGQRPARSES
jgi:hypothetical protein